MGKQIHIFLDGFMGPAWATHPVRGKDASAAFTAAKQQLAALNIELKQSDGEYRVNFKGGSESTAYYTDDLEDAVASGKAMHRTVMFRRS